MDRGIGNAMANPSSNHNTTHNSKTNISKVLENNFANLEPMQLKETTSHAVQLAEKHLLDSKAKKSQGFEDDLNAKRPRCNYVHMVSEAISTSPEGKLTVSQIYDWFIQQYPYFKKCQSNWRNSIRHLLSMNPHFKRIPRSKTESGKGSYWTLVSKPVGMSNPMRNLDMIDFSSGMCHLLKNNYSNMNYAPYVLPGTESPYQYPAMDNQLYGNSKNSKQFMSDFNQPSSFGHFQKDMSNLASRYINSNIQQPPQFNLPNFNQPNNYGYSSLMPSAMTMHDGGGGGGGQKMQFSQQQHYSSTLPQVPGSPSRHHTSSNLSQSQMMFDTSGMYPLLPSIGSHLHENDDVNPNMEQLQDTLKNDVGLNNSMKMNGVFKNYDSSTEACWNLLGLENIQHQKQNLGSNEFISQNSLMKSPSHESTSLEHYQTSTSAAAAGSNPRE